MMQNILVGIIVVLASFFFIKKVYKALSGKENACNCGCNGCKSKKECCKTKEINN
ncbi:MAG: FeoB-associated Cys-rich membrane protein [Bacteroidales bacterium]|nr:FeoB-associated Cys-rich membrane protein [Bacteroidales bacterium]